MAFKFDEMYNKFAKGATSLNRGVNKIIGKDVFQDVKEIEAPREFQPYESFPAYEVVEPDQWKSKEGTVKKFPLEGSVIIVQANFDTCMQYYDDFKITARYYADRFKFKYKNCVTDFDALIHYFEEMYYEGLEPMIKRACGLLFLFGIYDANVDKVMEKHLKYYNRAISSCETMAGIEMTRNKVAEQSGELVGNSIRMQGGGFGFKGAVKGIAMAESVNLGLGMLGKFVAHQNKMSQEEKADVFEKFKQDVFFEEVYIDYVNTFFTIVQLLAEHKVLDNVTTHMNSEYSAIIENLQNPMFPKDKKVPLLVTLIQTCPFGPAAFEILKQKFGDTEEVKQIIDYFAV